MTYVRSWQTFPGARWICAAQGWFYIVTGVWPLLHSPSFEWVTGPKRDLWLAQTVGLLLAVTGAALLYARYTRRLSGEIAVLAIGVAGALAIMDVVALWQPYTAPSYLLDAVVEIALVVVWVRALRRGYRATERNPSP